LTRVLILSHADVLAALPGDECEQAMTAVLAAHARGEAFMPLRSMMFPPGAAGLMGLMPAWRGDQGSHKAAFALKAICLIRANPARGLDAHQGIVALFDGATGVPTAILDASAITAVRTAAVTACATRALAREDSTSLAILGAGVQARSHLEALMPVRAFDHVRVFAPTQAHARAVIDGASASAARAELTVARSAELAVRGADVVVVATSATEPVIEHRWLAEGAHVNAIGAGSPNAREIDVATVAAAALFPDSRESLRNEAGEFILAAEQGAITGEDHVRAELGEVLAGCKPGRRDDDELTLFRSLGLGVEDLAAAELAVANARDRAIGTEVEL
jgi:ornithine cyclodeaminase/alanine dehydrogenase-like protein (mu-crystallin family)